MLKNLLCKVLLEDGILLNNYDIYGEGGYGAVDRNWGLSGNIINNSSIF